MAEQGFTIYQLPTIANPEAFDSIADLRRELHRTNRELMDACAREQTLHGQGQELMQTLYKTLLLHLKGVTLLTGYLDAYLEERPRLREKLEEELAAAAETKVH